MTSLMEERLQQAIARKRTQLAEVEETAKNLKRDLNELTFIMGGTEKGGEEVVRRAQAKANRNGWSPWSEPEDRLILDYFKSKDTPTSAPIATKDLVRKIHNRTEGAIRLRINRLMLDGVLKKASKKGSGSTTAMLMEAA